MRTLLFAIAAAAFVAQAAPAYADGGEPPMTTRRVSTEGRSLSQICLDLQTEGRMPGTVSECVAETRAQNNLAATDALPDSLRVLVYGSPEPAQTAESATATARPQAAATQAAAPSTDTPDPPADTSDEEEDDGPPWGNYALLAVLAALLLALMGWLMRRRGAAEAGAEDDVQLVKQEEEIQPPPPPPNDDTR